MRLFAIAFVLSFLGCVPREQRRGFTDACRYWVNLDGAQTVEASRLAGFVKVFLNVDGIEYLLEKMNSKLPNESQVATVLLMLNYEVLIQTDTDESRRLMQMIKRSSFMDKAREYSISACNSAIQESLEMFLVRVGIDREGEPTHLDSE